MKNRVSHIEQSLEAPLLEVRDLSITFQRYEKGRERQELQVISELSVTVNAGEIVAIVGSSGSGKSLLAHGILGLLPKNSRVGGKILYQGNELNQVDQQRLRGKEIAFVPQSVSYLDPLMKVGKQVIGVGGGEEKKVAQWNIFRRLGLKKETQKLYPFQLSGGMARRVLVSTAVISDASLIIADEPTPGMSVEQAMEALQIFKELAEEGKGVLLITHDIDLAVQFADRVAIFYGGSTLEEVNAKHFTGSGEKLQHPYTRALWKALPQNEFTPLKGLQPYAGALPEGCIFGPRCECKGNRCDKERPRLKQVADGYVRCFHDTGRE